MGNNGAYTNFESLTVDLYNKGLLNKEILSSIMEQYRGTDIDSGGSQGLVANDGLNVVAIVIKTFGKELPVMPDVQKNWKDRTEKQEELYDKYVSDLYDLFRQIAYEFGWCQ